MSWWSIVKMPLDVGASQRNLYADRTRDFEDNYQVIIKEKLIPFLEGEITGKIRDVKLNRANYWTVAANDIHLVASINDLVALAKMLNINFVEKLNEDLTQNFNSPTTASYSKIGKQWVIRVTNPKVKGEVEAEDSDVHIESN